jgi:hypothetical protein
MTRFAIAALLFASSAVWAYGQPQEKSPAATPGPAPMPQSHATTHPPSARTVRPFSGQSLANDPTGGKAVLTPPTAREK